MEKIEYRYRFWYRYRPKFMVSVSVSVSTKKASIAHHYVLPPAKSASRMGPLDVLPFPRPLSLRPGSEGPYHTIRTSRTRYGPLTFRAKTVKPRSEDNYQKNWKILPIDTKDRKISFYGLWTRINECEPPPPPPPNKGP